MKSKIISVVLCMGVVLALTLVPGVPPVNMALAQPSHIGVNVTPQQTTVGFHENFTVVVWIGDSLGENYDGVGIRLVYNTSYVTATGVTDAGTFDWVLNAGTINNTWNATHGLVKYDAANMGGSLNASNRVCTINFTSNSSNTGISGLDFIYIGADAATSVTSGGADILNWTYVVNGTVRAGMPALTVNVTPAGKGTVKANGVTLTGYPNTTTRSWDALVSLEAVNNSTSGWGFVSWTGNLTGSTNPTSITMNATAKNVTANFAELPPKISPVPTSLTFNGNVGGNVTNKTLDIYNGGGGILNWTANITGVNATWLSMSPMSGGNLAAAQFNATNVAVNTTGLTAGTYHANITISGAVPGAPEGAESAVGGVVITAVTVPVTLNLGVPEISASPTPLTFTTNEGENPADKTLEVCNSGTGTLNWSLTDNAAWLSETPTSGSLDADDCEDVTVSVAASGLAAGDYSATITIIDPSANNTPQTVSVSLSIVSTGAGIPGAPGGIAPPAAPASLSASGLHISPHQIKPGQEVTISINVANSGGETGSYNAVLYINGAVEDSQLVSLAGGMTKNVIFMVSKSDAGVYDVSIAGQSGQFEVVHTGWFGGGLGTGGIIVIVVIVIVLILALVFVLRGTRRAV
jgi:hypothetical protein